MSKVICPICQSSYTTQLLCFSPQDGWQYRCEACQYRWYPDAKDKTTLFNRITVNEETLAKTMVYNKMYMVQNGILQYWVSSYFSTIIEGKSWEYEAEAIAATVAKLKEVSNDHN